MWIPCRRQREPSKEGSYSSGNKVTASQISEANCSMEGKYRFHNNNNNKFVILYSYSPVLGSTSK